MQVNTGLLCDQACRHCHLECGPDRSEVMEWPVMEQVLGAAEAIGPRLVEIAGGAPEMNPHIREFVSMLRDRGFAVRLRTNLTAMAEPGMDDLPAFLRERGVKLVASVPCHTDENICRLHMTRVLEKSIRSLQLLRKAGYTADPELQLNLVYNPGGTLFPGRQSTAQAAYRRELYSQYRLTFTRRLSITDMPPGRYRARLRQEGRDVQYAHLLRKAFNPGSLDLLSCRHQVSIGWDGVFYDCDFNLALNRTVDESVTVCLDDADLGSLSGRRIVTGDHCFGCTAGYGLSRRRTID